MSSAHFSAGQVVTVFRSRLLDDPDERYEELTEQLERRAHDLGGLIDVKSFVADDGERVTLVTFEDRSSHDRWATDATHRGAQGLGRTSIYAAYSVQVGECTRASQFVAPTT